jgi:ribonuclease-3
MFYPIIRQVPENFTIRSLDLVNQFLFREILELVDINWKGKEMGEGCNRFHLMPRFARSLPGTPYTETRIYIHWRQYALL